MLWGGIFEAGQMSPTTWFDNDSSDMVGAPKNQQRKPRIIILTTSLLTDRMFLYSNCLSHLAANADVEVWATSQATSEPAQVWSQSPVSVFPFPEVRPFREYPHNFLRRMNERAWDCRLDLPSRRSMAQHNLSNKSDVRHRCIRSLGSALGALRLHRVFERGLELMLATYPRSREAERRFKAKRPDLVVTTGPFWFDEPAVTAHAKRLGIPVMALIPSWDNVTTKNRMVFRYDGYLVWSQQTRQELNSIYPNSADAPVFDIGAVQFDVFKQSRFEESRADFCQRHGLRPDRPIIVYAIGSPYFIRGEVFGAMHLAERIAHGALANSQMLVRPHPTKDNAELISQFSRYQPFVVVQRVAEAGRKLNQRSQDSQQILDWISTFRHADVVVNLASTVCIDAALFDKPVVNMNYDPSPGSPQESLIKDINKVWSHFRPIAESGGVTLVDNNEELVNAVSAYLQQPDLHREKRRWMAEHVCGFVDGKCGERMAEAVLQFARLSSVRSSVDASNGR